ncbi:MAG: ABC transporter substrate-binding protein [Actinomycetota bacterium]
MRGIRSARAGALFALMVLFAAACGGEDGDGADLDADLGGSVEIAAVWTGAEQESFELVLDEFSERTGTEVTFTSTGDEIATVLRTRIEGGSPPQLAILPQPGLLNDLAEQDALEPIDEIVGDLVDESYAPIWRDLGSSSDDTLYGLFFKGDNKSTVFYNVGAFEDAGVEPPATWEEFIDAAQTLRDAGTTPLAIGGEAGWVLTDWFENIYIRMAGPEAYDQLTNHEIPWTDESVTEALELFAEVLSDDSLTLDQPTNVGFEESVDAVFADEPTAAMVFEGDFVPGATDVAKAAEPVTDYDVFDFPSIEGSDPAVVGGGSVVVMLEDTPQSRALLEFLGTPEAAEIIVAQGGFSSPNRDVDEAAYPNEIGQRTASSLADAEVFRFDLSDLVPTELGGDVPGSMWSILQDFAQDPSDVQGTAQRLEEVAARAFG